MKGVCKLCGCTQEDACTHPEFGSCFWLDENKELCSHCVEIPNDPLLKGPKINHNYKVLPLWQPWASLLAHGVKGDETRPKATNWTIEKGTYLIHAAQKWTKKQKELCFTEPFKQELVQLGYIIGNKIELPLGYIIGAFDVSCCRDITVTESCKKRGIPYPVLDDDLFVSAGEISFGDYRHGRSAWIGVNHKMIEKPIPYKGSQGYYANFHGKTKDLIFKEKNV
jgi:hypothetical protein